MHGPHQRVEDGADQGGGQEPLVAHAGQGTELGAEESVEVGEQWVPEAAPQFQQPETAQREPAGDGPEPEAGGDEQTAVEGADQEQSPEGEANTIEGRGK